MFTGVDTARYLGPAKVRRTVGKEVELDLPDQIVWARLALAVAYTPCANDEVLVIGENDAWFVIGVLDGQGPTVFRARGELRFEAPNGGIHFHSTRAVRFKSPLIQLLADRLDVTARSVFERFTSVTRWISETLQLRAGRVRVRVDGQYDLHAQRIAETADRDVVIDGEKIHLG